MRQQDAAKARIKKLEGDMLGLLHKLNRLRSAPVFPASDSVTDAFNAKTERAPLHTAFHAANQMHEILQQQIIDIQNELGCLAHTHIPAPEFRLAA